jgi:hypothetical protein
VLETDEQMLEREQNERHVLDVMGDSSVMPECLWMISLRLIAQSMSAGAG